MGLVVPRHVGSSRTRDWTHVPCIGRRILNHCTTREALFQCFTESLWHLGILHCASGYPSLFGLQLFYLILPGTVLSLHSQIVTFEEGVLDSTANSMTQTLQDSRLKGWLLSFLCSEDSVHLKVIFHLSKVQGLDLLSPLKSSEERHHTLYLVHNLLMRISERIYKSQ